MHLPHMYIDIKLILDTSIFINLFFLYVKLGGIEFLEFNETKTT
jgi:hypothetical protein